MTTSKKVFITGCSDGGNGSVRCAFSGQRMVYFCNNTRYPEEISEAVKTVEENRNGLDIVINNAGRNDFSPVLDIDIVEAKEIYDSNIWELIAFIQTFVPLVIGNKALLSTSLRLQDTSKSLIWVLDSRTNPFAALIDTDTAAKTSTLHRKNLFRSQASTCDSRLSLWRQHLIRCH
ncbi:hypothetical protein EYC80_007779 [Monilinia laxa]|uniref:Ketoreductase (KR) domain-containing protein n=1 Tax=Monilinia laxa TaxID=61186 RepID=A0A5N6JWZ0_MONLA|nr:hypothetical protein EYC80_007779 [Monilinia laxa]